MTPDSLITVMTAAVVVSAIAIVFQAAILFGMYRAIKGMQEKVSALIPKAESTISAAEKAIAETRKEIGELSVKVNSILESTKKQVALIDDFLGDTSQRAKARMEQIEMALDDTVSRVHGTVVTVNNGIMRPIRELNGLAAGLKAAFGSLLRGNRPNVAEVTADEEMFI